MPLFEAIAPFDAVAGGTSPDDRRGHHIASADFVSKKPVPPLSITCEVAMVFRFNQRFYRSGHFTRPLSIILVLCFFASSTNSAQAASVQSKMRGWLLTHTVFRCFPGAIGSSFFVSNVGGLTYPKTVPINPIPWSGRKPQVEPSWDAHRNAFVMQIGDSKHPADVQVFVGARDDSASLVALQHGGYEYRETALVSEKSNIPGTLRTKTVQIALPKGVTIGSTRAAVEATFGYAGRAVTVQRCGMLAERFGTVETGAAWNYSFIFRDGRVVALDYAFGS